MRCLSPVISETPVTFNTMIGPDGSTPLEMHGQHGVAFIESHADSSTNNHTGFSALTLTPQAGYAFIAGDFALDQLDSLTTPTGKVTFTTIDCGSWTLDIAQHGQNQYNFITDGTLITSLTISVPTTDLRVDLKQLSLDVAQVPLPGTLSLFAAGLALLGWLGGWQRKQRT